MIVRRRVNNSQQEANETEERKEILDFTKPDFSFIPQGFHKYKQVGYYLVCTSCEIQHAIWVGPHKILVGVDEKGAPVLKTRKELGIA